MDLLILACVLQFFIIVGLAVHVHNRELALQHYKDRVEYLQYLLKLGNDQDD